MNHNNFSGGKWKTKSLFDINYDSGDKNFFFYSLIIAKIFSGYTVSFIMYNLFL